MYIYLMYVLDVALVKTWFLSFLNTMNMKKITSLLVLLSAVFLTPAPVSAVEHYVSGSIGIPAYQDLNSTFSFYNAPTLNLVRDTNISLNSGVLLFGAIGNDYGSFRIEGELGYQTFNFDKIKVHSTGIGQTATTLVSKYIYDMSGGAFNETSTFSLAGKGNVTSLMVNAYYLFPVGGGIKPFVTAGTGVAQVRYADFNINNLPNPDDSNVLNRNTDNTTTFAYQLGAGVAVPVSRNVTFDAFYRYFTTARYNMPSFGADTSMQNHQFLVNVRVGI